jgi:hypothetical protein
MPDNSGWMGDPNDIKGKLLFEQSKKGANPEKAASDASKAKLAKAKAEAAAAQKAAMLKKASKMKPKFVIPASKFH